MKTETKDFDRVGLAIMFNLLEFKAGAEIGVGRADYAFTLARQNRKAILYCVDPWKENEHDYKIAMRRLQPFRNVVILRHTSANAYMPFRNESLDYVYIDAAHDYENVSFDINAWAKKVKPDGIVAGHDYGIKDVRRAVDEYAEAHDIKTLYLLADGQSWYFVKP